MVERELKRRIMENRFIFDIRHLQIDEAAFAELCKALEELAVFWKDCEQIDKEMAAELYVIVIVTQNAEAVMRKHGDTKSDIVADMVQELDRLVLECFHCE